MIKRLTALMLCTIMLMTSVFVGNVSASEITATDIPAAVSESDKPTDTPAATPTDTPKPTVSGTDTPKPTVSDSDSPVSPDNPPQNPDDPTPPQEPEIKFDELKTVLTAKTAGYNSIHLSWEAVEGAVKYEIWSSGSLKGTYVYTVGVSDATEYTRTGRAFNKTFYYKVRGVNSDGEYTQFSEIASAKTQVLAPNAKAASYSYNKIKVSWNKVAGASGYMIYRATSANGKYTQYKRITKGSTTSYVNSSLTHGKTYYYKVRAYRTSGGKRIYGAYSEIVSAKPRLSKPSTVTLKRSSYYINVSWSSVSGATGYKVYRATDPEGDYILLGTTSSKKRTFKNTSVVPNVVYYYKIVATRSGVEGLPSTVKSASAVMAKPSSFSAASASGSSIKVSWGTVSGATGYVVYKSETADGEFVEIARTTAKSYTDNGLTLGKTYYYKVAGYRTSKGLTGVGTLTAAVSAAPKFTAPAISSVKKNSSSSLKIAWKASGGADGYYLYRSTSKSGTYSQIAKLEGNDKVSYVDEGRTSNKYYYYKIKAYRIVDGEEVLSSFSSYKSGRITKKVAYLTFDDGPSSNTIKILDILDKYDVKATFFVIGKSGRDKEYKAIVDRGHTIALHSYSHNYAKVYASEKAFWNEMNKVSDKIYSVTGVRTKILRFPGGSSNTVYKKYCRGLMAKLKKSVPAKGYYYHDWNVSSGDASGNNISKYKIIANIKNGCKNKTTVNILMHDTGSAKRTTVEALPAIIEYLLAQGYDIQPITEDSVLIQH